MNINNIPFGITNWLEIPITRHEGEQGYALWRTQQFDNIRVRIVEYSENYLADHAEAHRSSTAIGAKLFIVD